MMTEAEIAELIKSHYPDAQVALMDVTGASDHFRLWVSTSVFVGKNLIEQHQLVYKALDEAMKDGRLHAIEIKTEVPTGV